MLRDITANEELLYIVHPLIHPLYVLCWPNDIDVGPTSSVQWMDVSCCLDKREAVATIYTLGHNYLGKSVVHFFVQLSVNYEPMNRSLKFSTDNFQVISTITAWSITAVINLLQRMASF